MGGKRVGYEKRKEDGETKGSEYFLSFEPRRNKEQTEEDKISENDKKGRSRDPEGYTGDWIQEVRGRDQKSDEKMDDFCQNACQKRAHRREQEKNVTANHDYTHKWNRDKIEDKSRKGYAVEGHGNKRQDSCLGSQAQGQDFAYSQGEPRKVFDDFREK